MSYSYVVRAGQYIHPHFTVVGTTAGSWATIGLDDIDMPTTIQAVFWEGASQGAWLQLKDSTGYIFYTHYQVSGSMNYLSCPLTLKPPFQYFDSEGNNTLVIFGQFT